MSRNFMPGFFRLSETRRRFWLDILILVLLTAASVWIYRTDLVDLPRGDQLDFMRERTFRATDWDYFVSQLSFNRTRIFYPGDFYQYRPGYNGYLAVMDIFFRDNLYVGGLISVGLHALSVFALYLLLRRLTGRLAAGLAAAAFVTQYAGMEMVAWRHISTYMLALLFFMTGLLELTRPAAGPFTKRRLGFIAFCFFTAMIFHETMMVLVAGCGLLFAAVKPGTGRPGTAVPQTALTRKILVTACLAPVLVYWILNVIDILHYRPSGFFGPSQTAQAGLSVLKVLYSVVYVAGLALTAFALPSLVTITYPNIFFRAYWHFEDLPPVLILAAGLALIAICLGWFLFSLFEYRRAADGPRPLIGIFVTLYLAVLVLGLVMGRVVLHSISYLTYSTYYYYITDYMIWIVAALLVTRILPALKVSGLVKKSGLLVLAGFVIYRSAVGYAGIQKSLAERSGFDRIVAETAREIAGAVGQKKDACYGGPFDSLLGQYATPTLLYNRRCGPSSKTALYGIAHPAAGFWLAEYIERPKAAVDLDIEKGNFLARDGRIVSGPPAGRLEEGLGMVLSRGVYDPSLVEVRMPAGGEAGLVVAYRDPGNFILVLVRDGTASVHVMAGGKLSPPIYQTRKILNAGAFVLSVRQTGAYYGVFYDRNVMMLLKEFTSIRGKVGLFAGRAEGGQAFSDFLVSERQAGTADVFLKPVVRLRLPALTGLYRAQSTQT